MSQRSDRGRAGADSCRKSPLLGIGATIGASCQTRQAWLIVMFASISVRMGLLGLTLAFGCTRSSSPSVGFGSGLPRVAASPAIERLEHEMFVRLNRDRKERELPALRYESALADVARFHSEDMRDKRFFAHDSPTSGSLEDRLNAAGYLFLTARENLSEAPDVQSGQDALLRSPGHYANIVATDTTHVGIGIVRGGVEAPENLSMTQVFALPDRLDSPAASRKEIVRRIRDERARRGLPEANWHALLEELAEQHIGELEAEVSASSLEDVGKRIAAAISTRKNVDLRGVAVGAQLLPNAERLEVPEALLRAGKARFALAVRRVPNAAGRPMLQVLLLVAQ